MYVPFLVTTPGYELENEKSFLRELEVPADSVYCGVISEGEAAEYALVWEFGNVRQTKKGPKTTIGITPDGKRVWLSIQAPFGYIRINEGLYWEIVREELGKISFSGGTGDSVLLEIKKASFRICDRVAEVIRDTVPVDTGALRASIVPTFPNDEIALPGFDESEEFDPNIGLASDIQGLLFL